MRLDGRVGGSRPGRKILSLVASMLLGGSHIDHADRLPAGSTPKGAAFPGNGVFYFGDVPSFVHMGSCPPVGQGPVRSAAEVLVGGWRSRGNPATIDVDGTICGVAGKTKAGAAYGYTGQLGYHPLVAAISETGEIVHPRLRGGSSRKGHAHFVVEAVNRDRRAGAAGPLSVRADFGVLVLSHCPWDNAAWIRRATRSVPLAG